VSGAGVGTSAQAAQAMIERHPSHIEALHPPGPLPSTPTEASSLAFGTCRISAVWFSKSVCWNGVTVRKRECIEQKRNSIQHVSITYLRRHIAWLRYQSLVDFSL
jgi:hypothetical protein